jgi:hypothetical protein
MNTPSARRRSDLQESRLIIQIAVVDIACINAIRTALEKMK